MDSIWLPRRQEWIRGTQRKGGKTGLAKRRRIPSLEPGDERLDTVASRFVESGKRSAKFPVESFCDFNDRGNKTMC